MSLNPHTIRETERDGMPEEEKMVIECPNCGRALFEEAKMECIQCKAEICPRCFHISKTFSEAFCTEEIDGRNIPTDCEVKWLEAQLAEAEEKASAWEKLTKNLQADLHVEG